MTEAERIAILERDLERARAEALFWEQESKFLLSILKSSILVSRYKQKEQVND